MSKLSVIGIVLLVVALIASLTQVWVYRKALNNAGAFVGDFPNNMPAIDNLIGHTTTKLYIVNDFCGYGQFSSPGVSRDYRNALVKLRKADMRVEVHVYTAELGAQMTAEQFNLQETSRASDTYKALSNKQAFKDYFAYHKENNDPLTIPPDYQSFLQLMNDEQTKCVDEFKTAGIDIRTDVSQRLPVFMWVRDDSEEAIFSIYNLGHDSREISEETRNKAIVLLLKDIAANYVPAR